MRAQGQGYILYAAEGLSSGEVVSRASSLTMVSALPMERKPRKDAAPLSLEMVVSKAREWLSAGLEIPEEETIERLLEESGASDDLGYVRKVLKKALKQLEKGKVQYHWCPDCIRQAI